MRRLRPCAAVLFALSTLTGRVASEEQGPTTPIPYHDNESYGPDGPWNFITVGVGDDSLSRLDFYPMTGDHATLLVQQDACLASTCIAPIPGYFDQTSATAKNATIDHTIRPLQGFGFSQPSLGLEGEGYWSTAPIHNPITFNDTLTYVSANVTQAQGKKRYTPVALLSLEAFLTSNVAKTTNQEFVTQNTILESFNNQYGGNQAWGLHIGSAKFNQSGSLYFGGYDQNRLIEKPAVFAHHGAQNLGAISIGIDGIPSSTVNPWTNATQRPPANMLNTTLSVYLSPQVPNLQLPSAVCASLARFLPIAHDADTNLYLWNTSSTIYGTLTKSSAYHLDFTWSDARNTTIKVPFALLDLTLTAPLKDVPTAYFPCEPTDGGPANLGRAFLQAAMLLMSYNPDATVVGQAPGPVVNQTTKPLVVGYNATKGDPGPGDGARKYGDTWKGFLASSGTSDDGSPSSSSSSPSAPASSSPSPEHVTPAAIGAIIAGCIGIVAFVAGIIWLDLRRQRNKIPDTTSAANGERAGLPPATRGAAAESLESGAGMAAGDRSLGPGDGVALKQYMQFAGVNGGWKPARPLRPPSELARLD